MSSPLFLVTGGCGFIGRYIAEAALERGFRVRVFDVVEGYEDDRIELLIGDIRNQQNVYEACIGVDVVFHLAALTTSDGSWSDYHAVNVVGTQNVLEGCRRCNVKSLIYTSTASVVIESRQIKNGEENSLKYPQRHLDYYCSTKAMAEQLVLQANSKGLATCALRPHIVFGPRDTHFIGKLMEHARRGDVTHIIGDGENVTDFTFIDNVVHAHMLAAEKLSPSAPCAGQAYFITNGEPRRFWDVVNTLLQDTGAGPRSTTSFATAYTFALIMEWLRWLLGRFHFFRSTISRHTLCLMTLNYWFNHSKATRDLGYRPVVSLANGLARCIEYSRVLPRAPSFPPRIRASQSLPSSPTGHHSRNNSFRFASPRPRTLNFS